MELLKGGDDYCCDECDGSGIDLIQFKFDSWLCKSCLERALRLINGEDDEK